MERKPKVLIVRLREVLAIDATGLRALEEDIDSALERAQALGAR